METVAASLGEPEKTAFVSLSGWLWAMPGMKVTVCVEAPNVYFTLHGSLLFWPLWTLCFEDFYLLLKLYRSNSVCFH